MLLLQAKIREGKDRPEILRKQGILPAVLYGSEIKSQSVQVDLKQFEKIFDKAGESSLITLKTENKEFMVLIHEIQKDPVSSQITHVDFYQPILTEEVEATVPLIFEGEALAVKDLGGTLVKEAQELTVKALPQNLPHDIKINVEILKTFEDEILVKDIKLTEGVKIIKEPEALIVKVSPPQKEEEEFEKPADEEAEKVEGAEGEEKTEGENKEEEVKEPDKSSS
ncbi:MAG: 50S ribosomal protein L25 [Candidatus Nealsonbacteria bacterium]